MVIANGSSRASATIQLLTLAVVYALTQPGNWLILPICGLIGAFVCSVAVPLSSRLWEQYDELVKRESLDVGLVPYSWGGVHRYEQQPNQSRDTFEQKSVIESVNTQRAQNLLRQPNNRPVTLPLHPNLRSSHRNHSHDSPRDYSPSERWEVLGSGPSMRKV